MYDTIFEDLSTVREHYMKNGKTSFDEASVMELLQDVHSENSQNTVKVVLELLNIQNFDEEVNKNTDKKDEPNFLSSDESIVELEVPKKVHPCIDLTSNSPTFMLKDNIKIEEDSSNISITSEDDSDNQIYDSPSPETSSFNENNFEDISNDLEKSIFSDLFSSQDEINTTVIQSFDTDSVSTQSELNKTLETSAIQSDNMQVLEENNNDPNNNMSVENTENAESMHTQAAVDTVDIMQLLDPKDDTTLTCNNENKTAATKSSNPQFNPRPGCSKDSNDTANQNSPDESMYNDSLCIQEIIPWADQDSILYHLEKHKNLQNRKELALWSLMKGNPVKSIKAVAPKRKSSSEDECSPSKKMFSQNPTNCKKEATLKIKESSMADWMQNDDSVNFQDMEVEGKNNGSNYILTSVKDKINGASRKIDCDWMQNDDSVNFQDMEIEGKNNNGSNYILTSVKGKINGANRKIDSARIDLTTNTVMQQPKIPPLIINMKNKSNLHIRPPSTNQPSCTITSASLEKSHLQNSIPTAQKEIMQNKEKESTANPFFAQQNTITSVGQASVYPPQSTIVNAQSVPHNSRIIIPNPLVPVANNSRSIIPNIVSVPNIPRSTINRDPPNFLSTAASTNPVAFKNNVTGVRYNFIQNPRSTITSASVPLITHAATQIKKPATFAPMPALHNNMLPNNQIYNYQFAHTAGPRNYNTGVNTLNSLKLPVFTHALASKNAISYPIASNSKKELSNSTAIKQATNIQSSQINKVNLSSSSETNKAASKSTREIPNKDMYYKLRSMFADVDSNYIRSICENPPNNIATTDKEQLYSLLVDHLLLEGNNHLQIQNFENAEGGKKMTVDEQYEHLLDIFPDADPTYIRKFVESNVNKENALEEFIQEKLEKHDYPTKEQYLANIKMNEQKKQYTTDFKVEKFLEIFPDPFTHFENNTRKCVFINHALEFLKALFNKHRVNTVHSVYKANKFNISLTAKALNERTPDMKNKRNGLALPPDDDNIPLFQEFAFVNNKEQILKHISNKKIAEEKRFKELEKSNALLECQCCFNDKCLPEKCGTCIEGHIFCHECIIRGTDSVISDGETVVKCFTNCTSEFSLTSLQNVLPPTKFSKLLQKRQAAEVIAAGVDGLVSCPFCHFASIPPPEDKVFKCLNPECMKESCRLCKEINHIPFKCGEQEKTDKARLLIEEKMTEALIRTCYKCKRQFFKEEGCNKMTCPCGAIMCYVCDQPVKDYRHFNAQGVNDKGKCPLWIDDKHVNAVTVRKVAEEVKNQMLQENPHLKIDTQSLLPALPARMRGPHDDILNANEYAARIRTVGNLHKRQ